METLAKITKTSLSDTPFGELSNDFGIECYVNGLIRFIEHASTPLTIALQGEWGSGKTSLMNRLRRTLCSGEQPLFVGVEINTWGCSMMSTSEMTVYKILEQLIRDLTKNDPRTQKAFKGFLRSAGNFLYRGARESLKVIPGVGGLLSVGLEAANVPTQLPDAEDDNSNVSLADLKNTLETAIQKIIRETGKKGVIVFVDDLDRLKPTVAVEILELLKNVFTLENCIFVLAIDYDVVVKGLKPKFGELTDKNEREFRSFFDKIIQVPFSLPVNNYHPMDFVLKSLVEIGYLDDLETSNPNLQKLLATIVGASVGKNPRSIKRLINTLSLQNCVAQCGQFGQSEKLSTNEKVLNFIVVALQISYPKIYRMLVTMPDFVNWNAEFATKLGIVMPTETSGNDTPNWEDILAAACESDTYLSQHSIDINNLFSIMQEKEMKGKMLKVVDKSSVTGMNVALEIGDFDKKDLIYKLHANVINRIKQLRPDIDKYQLKRNTGNGGMYLWISEEKYFWVIFNPFVNEDNKVVLRIQLDICVERPERLKDKAFDEVVEDDCIADALKGFDAVLAPLLGESIWYFRGRTYNNDISFSSYLEELRYLHEKGYMQDELITDNPDFFIVFDKPSCFENTDVVDVVANVIIAGFDFRKTWLHWK